MKPYDPKKIEKKWQAAWEKKKPFKADKKSKKPKWYSLVEFPYPSGEGLHTGHVRGYTAMDIISRKRRMEGFNVLYPIGWDAFGLPTENYAIKTGIQPAVITKKNTDTYRKQMKSLGLSFDWSREINTTDPKYYKWTQWLFLQFLKHDLAYKKKMNINWCPKDKIGLANEEVVNGCCERCGTPVEKREKEQWMLAITKYADRLDKDLDDVDYLPQIKLQQRNWIGKSEGAEIEFEIKNNESKIKVFTTRPDTIFGATYLVVSPEHEILKNNELNVENYNEVTAYITEAKKKTEIERTDHSKEKTGIELMGVKVINPATHEEIPLWVADYVLAQYGTGAIMAVPAHDERDYSFAKKYSLSIKKVIEPVFIQDTGPDKIREDRPLVEREAITAIVKHWKEDKYIGLKWKKVDWETLITGGVEPGQTAEEAAIAEIRQETGYQNLKLVKVLPRTHAKFFHVPKDVNRFAHFHVLYFELQNDEQKDLAAGENEIHDVIWLTSAEMEKFRLPESHRYSWQTLTNESELWAGNGILTGSGSLNGADSIKVKNELIKLVNGKAVTTFKLRDWVFSRQRYWGEPIPVIHCPDCGVVPVLEKDLPVTLPKVKKYEPTDNGESPLADITSWVNVKCPKCKGKAKRETDTMPNWAGSSWYFLRYTDPKNSKAFAGADALKYFSPIDWYNGGMEHTTLHLLYSRFWNKFLFDLGLVPTSEPYKKRTSHGLILAEGGEKMSKSKGNVVNPDTVVSLYGADTLRIYEMFMGPFDQPVAWSTDSIIGSRRFIERVWKMGHEIDVKKKHEALNEELEPLLHKTIVKVGADIETMSFNTAISSLMILLNEFEKHTPSTTQFESFLCLLAPFAPHVADELWLLLENKKSVHEAQWPVANLEKISAEKVTIAVQVNGKVRTTFQQHRDATEEETVSRVKSIPEIVKWVGDNQIKKIIFVKNRLVNIVI
jgi:leucyl-tRNA synthetase